MWRDLERTCSALGLPFRRPSRFPRNGLLAARIACCFQEEGWLPDFVRATYLANFAEDAEISDASVIGSILRGIGQPEERVARASSPEAKAKLRAQSERARALEIFGAPSFVVGSELFWGNDRLEAAIAWAVQPGERTQG
jgi:2-hydroxychromene-2-carboxylate isomerase